MTLNNPLNLTLESDLHGLINSQTASLLNIINTPLCIADHDGKIVFWNNGAQELTGFTSESMLNKLFCEDSLISTSDIGISPDDDDHPVNKVLKNGLSFNGKFSLKINNGQQIPVSILVNPVKDKQENTKGVLVIFRDNSLEEKYLALQSKFDKMIRQYVSSNTYDSILQSKASEEGSLAKFRELTIFFMDIVSFTTISEKNQPSVIVEVLNSFFSMASWLILINNGDIDKFIGDCAMAVFGDPDNAVKCCKDILNIGLPELNNMLTKRNMPNVSVRIGLSTGLLIQGDIGCEFRKDFTVIGDVVNTASRVQHAAPINNLSISESTYARITNKDEFEFETEMMLKGKQNPVKLYNYKKS